jgi:chromosome segregation ATPase
VLAVQDTAGLQAQLQQSLAQVASARASLSQAMSNAAMGPAKSSAALNTAMAQVRSAKSQLQKQLNGARPEERRQALARMSAYRREQKTTDEFASRAAWNRQYDSDRADVF